MQQFFTLRGSCRGLWAQDRSRESILSFSEFWRTYFGMIVSIWVCFGGLWRHLGASGGILGIQNPFSITFWEKRGEQCNPKGRHRRPKRPTELPKSDFIDPKLGATSDQKSNREKKIENLQKCWPCAKKSLVFKNGSQRKSTTMGLKNVQVCIIWTQCFLLS